MTIKGEKFLFLVDTGAAVNILTPEAAQLLKLKATGKADGLPSVKVADPRLGHIQLPELKFTIRKSTAGSIQAKGYTYGGIIGSRTLVKLKATLDFDSYHLIIDKSIAEK